MSLGLLAAASAAIWLYLLLGRGLFWRAAERDDRLDAPAPASGWPSVTAVVPARNEASIIAESLGSLFRQSYPGRFRIVLVDDESTDATAELAHAAARAANAEDRLTIVAGTRPPGGWTGKLFAMHQGVTHLAGEPPHYILFTDADIAYRASDSVERLVRGAAARRLVLTSLMVKLRCESLAERLLVPAFVFFFDMLYPFRWVNDPRRTTAAAAGGCMLVEHRALVRAGGLEAIRGALIDDCALGRLMKREGPIWLGLTERVESLRPYPDFNDMRRMVVRSAFAELRYSYWRLAGALVGMLLTYAAPPLLAIFASGMPRVLGLAAWIGMALAFQPMLRLYRRSPLWGVALPLTGVIYTAFTLESALEHRRGRGGAWKGRFQAASAGGVPPR